VKTAIRKHFKDFVAVLALVLISGGVAVYILGKQRMRFPFVQPKPFVLNAEFSTAQAVIAGQGQTVRVSGVRIGDIGDVQLKDGRAIVRMDIDHQYEHMIHTDATALLRPKTGLKDMFIQLDRARTARRSRRRTGRSRSTRRRRTSTPTRSSRRSTRTRATTCGC
jgi:phospholipid/cholesterol/gamma-HCH transport system substrate-binding protein